MTKDQMRAELEHQARSFVDEHGGEVTLYATQRIPERQAWRKRPTLLDAAFQDEIRKLENSKR